MELSDTRKSQPESSLPAAQRLAWAILITATLYICYFSHLDVIGFVGPDEPRYAWIARDMAESGDWITPRLYGKPWFEKPPLLYWGGAFFFKLVGEGHPEIAARLPSAFSALLATLVLAWFVWRTYGEETARCLLLLLPTSVGMIGVSHACATDMPFAGMLTIAMVCAAVVLELHYGPHNLDTKPVLPRTSWLALLLCGFFVGLAVLAKGPAGFLLVGGAVLFWALFTKRWRDAFGLLHPAAIAAFCVTALPWYILCARRNPDFFRVFIIEHNFKRYLTPEFQHIQPFWFYIPVLLVAFIPWSLVGVGAAANRLGEFLRVRAIGPLAAFTLSWAIFCLVFFSIAKSKLPGYILPAIPPFGIFLSTSFSTEKLLERRSKSLILALTALMFFAALAFFYHQLEDYQRFVPSHSHRLDYGQTLAALVAFFFLSLSLFFATLSFWVRRNSVLELPFLGASILVLALLIGGSGTFVESTGLNRISGKTLAPVAAHYSGEMLRLSGFRRDYRYVLSFYLRREVLDWKENPIKNGFVLTNGISCEELNTRDRCKNLSENADQKSNWALLQITPADSLAGSGGRQPQQKE